MKHRLAAVCALTLIKEAKQNPKIWMLDGDLADSYSATEFANELPKQFVMAGIAEQNMVSMAAGMASCGLLPWVFSFAAFLAYRSADQVRVSISQTALPVTLVGSHAGGCGGRNGKTHQSLSDLAVLGGFPGIDIWSPCDAADAVYVTKSVLQSGRPAYIRAPREHCSDLPGVPGGFRWLTKPTKTVLVASGLSSHWALEVHRLFSSDHEELSVLQVSSFSPLPDGLKEILTEANQWYVIEDHVRHGGLADSISRSTSKLPSDWFGWPSNWSGGSGEANELRQSCGLDATKIASKIQLSLK